MLKHSFLIITLALFFDGCSAPDKNPSLDAQRLRVGFDIDDTILFSRDNFLEAPHHSDDPDHLDYAWVNRHDSLYSQMIEPIKTLVTWYHEQGHGVYFITARPGDDGAVLARFLSRELGFQVVVDRELFFSPKEKHPLTGKRYTTKHRVMKQLGLHIYFGDSDTDMIAASIAGVRAVRVLRDPRSIRAYSKNYFGNILSPEIQDAAPFDVTDYERFIQQGVGPYGEHIYPLYIQPLDSMIRLP